MGETNNQDSLVLDAMRLAERAHRTRTQSPHQRIYSMLKGRDLLPDLHAYDGGRVLSRSTNSMTSFHC